MKEEITQAMYDDYGLYVKDAENDATAGICLFHETFMEHLKKITGTEAGI